MSEILAARIAALPLLALAAHAQTTSLASQNLQGVGGDWKSDACVVSGNGRYVAFSSLSSNLVPGDANGQWDIFVRDLQLGSVELASLASDGSQAVFGAREPDISPDGRFVVFETRSDNLSDLDSGIELDVYLKDRLTGQASLVSVGHATGLAEGAQRPSVSADGRWVAFRSHSSELVPGDTNSEADIFVRDMQLGVTIRANVSSSGAQADTGPGAFGSDYPSISDDGTRVAFTSFAKNLTPGDTDYLDVFVRDIQAGWTRRVSVDSAGQSPNDFSTNCALSPDGRFVSYTSRASNLVPGDTNGAADVFVHDLETAVTERVSVSSAGLQGTGDSGANGPLNTKFAVAALSAGGRYVSFESLAPDLVPGDTNGEGDVFRRDRLLGVTERMSVQSGGGEGAGRSTWSAMSSDGLQVAFLSTAPDLVSPPQLVANQVYVREPSTCPPPSLHCTAKINSQACLPAISWTGAPSASGETPFSLVSIMLLNQQTGIFIYGKNGPATIPFQGGFLCGQPPLVRTGPLGTGGTPPPTNCTGLVTFDFTAWVTGGNDVALVPGQSVDGQFWYRDPAASFGSGLTDAVGFVMCP